MHIAIPIATIATGSYLAILDIIEALTAPDMHLDMHSLLQMMLRSYIATPGIMHSKQFMHI